MKIVSLLPAATEIVYALGLGDDLVGVTDECDFPADAVTKPVVSHSALAQGRPLTSREIDAAVRQKMGERQPLYRLDIDLIRREQPDVILTQDLCRVCAVPAGHVEQALAQLGLSEATKVVSLDPSTLGEVVDQIEIVGSLLGASERAAELATQLRARIASAKQTAVRLPTVNVFCLEWAEPPFAAGHWVPEMVEAVGATNLLGAKGEPSRTVTHREIRDASPEVLIYMPCGYYLEEAEVEGVRVIEHPEIADTPAVRNHNAFAVDATSFFSRPGPRIVDGLEILAWAVHPEAYSEPPAGSITRF
ncbi:MAG: cobalamin-binding protein [Actinomycetota bacterium]|nr:cobalamin-binding protein [Actinomycetota bacterium]MDH5223880.1 cobalamin-binding protein [Actinomycetota bacterium]MDH5312986.1 cobalamin-binding protein [Actinomycetota bacterium]